MFVFIDESGDPGFKLTKGSSETFVLTMVIFDNGDDARKTQDAITACMRDCRVKPEWKFNKASYECKDAFFKCLVGHNFQSRTVVVQKNVIRSHHLRTKPREFYSFFTRMMMNNDGGVLRDAKIIIDGSGDRKFKKEFQSYLRKQLPKGTFAKLAFKDSQKDPLVQLADMCAGAIARSYHRDRKDPNRWRNMLAKSGHIQDIWDFR